MMAFNRLLLYSIALFYGLISPTLEHILCVFATLIPDIYVPTSVPAFISAVFCSELSIFISIDPLYEYLFTYPALIYIHQFITVFIRIYYKQFSFRICSYVPCNNIYPFTIQVNTTYFISGATWWYFQMFFFDYGTVVFT